MGEHWTPGHDGIPRYEQSSSPEAIASERDRYVTPDGVVLSGWWRRLIAYWIDGVIVAVAVQALLLPLGLLDPVTWFGSMPDDAITEALTPPFTEAWAYAVLSLAVTLVASAAYSILMLSRLGWTLGKRLLGIRVRHRELERLPTAGEAATRWAVQLAPAVLSPTPWVGAAAGLWTTLDGLWPLWDARRQAIHDRIVGTSVVRA